MTFKIIIHPRENERLNNIVMDIIISAAFFQRRDVDIQQDEETFTFMFNGYCPNEYFGYLTQKYDLSLEYLDR